MTSGPPPLLADGLPFNRKERWFTATVLPALILADDLAALAPLLDDLGLPHDPPAWTEQHANVQVYTEYGAGESAKGFDARFADLPMGRDTPDLVIYQPGRFLLGIEAKMFDRPSLGALTAQVARQRAVLDVLATGIGLDPGQVSQMVLLPQAIADEIGPVPGAQTRSWEHVRDLYPDGPRWARDVLDHAHIHRAALMGTGYGAGADRTLTGAEIVAGFEQGDLVDAVVGRNKGLSGTPLSADIDTGAWAETVYQVRDTGPTPNSNWFSAAAFVARTRATGAEPDTHLESWRLVRDVVRRFGETVYVAETHPGDGAYDALELRNAAADTHHAPFVRLTRNGSIWLMGGHDGRLAQWVDLANPGMREHVLVRIGTHLSLDLPPGATRLTGSAPRPFLEMVVAALDLAAGGMIEPFTVVSAVRDGGNWSNDPWKRDLLAPFEQGPTRVWFDPSADLFDQATQRWWVIERDGEPLALAHLDGKVWFTALAEDVDDIEPAVVATQTVSFSVLVSVVADR